jgi:hypothetical protein
MLNQAALAHSLAILTGALYLLFYLISLIAPELFKHLFNAQFLGANVASLLPKKFTFIMPQLAGIHCAALKPEDFTVLGQLGAGRSRNRQYGKREKYKRRD